MISTKTSSPGRSLRAIRACTLAIGFFLAVFTLATDALAQSVVCRLPRIEGYDREYARAKAILPTETLKFEQASIYITKGSKGELYIHSNFKNEPGGNATKIATNEITNLLDVFANIVGVDGDSPRAVLDGAIEAHKTKVKYFLDKSLLKADGTIDLDLAGASQFAVVFDGETVARKALRLEHARGPPRFVVGIGSETGWKGLYAPASPSLKPSAAVAALQKQAFRSKDFVLIKLVDNSATDKAIADAGLGVHVAQLEGLTADAVETVFKRNQGKTIAPLGHFESGSFVMTDSRGVEVLRLPFALLEGWAKQYRVNLIPLGCEVASAGMVGPLDKFNTVEVAALLGNAVKSDTLGGFFASLASTDLQIVVPDLSRLTEKVKTFEVIVTQKAQPTPFEEQLADLRTVGVIRVVLAGNGAGGGSPPGGGEEKNRQRENSNPGVQPSQKTPIAPVTPVVPGDDDDDKENNGSARNTQNGSGKDRDARVAQRGSESASRSAAPWIWLGGGLAVLFGLGWGIRRLKA